MALIRRSSIAYPRQWNPATVPTWPVEIDRGHPLGAALASLIIPGSRYGLLDIATGAVPASQTGTVYVQTPGGPGINYQTTAAGVFYPASYNPITTSNGVGTGDYTVASSVNLSAALTGQTYIIGQGGGGGQLRFCAGTDYQLNNLAGAVALMQYNGSFQGASTATGAADGLFHTWSGTRTAGAYSVYKDGINATLASAASSATTLGSGYGFALGNYPPGAQNYSPTCSQTWAAAWNTALPQALHEWLAAEPFIMLRPIIRRQYYAAAAGNTPGTISATASGTSSATATLAGHGTLTTTAAATSTTTVALTAHGALAAAPAATSTTSATITGAGTLSASALASSAASATLHGFGPISGIVSGASAASVTLHAAGSLSATAAGTSAMSATLAGGQGLSATAAGTSTASATLTGNGAISAALVGTSAMSATLTGSGALSAVCVSASEASATIVAPAIAPVTVTPQRTITSVIYSREIVGHRRDRTIVSVPGGGRY